ncbi:MAG: histidine kinase [Bacteroidota bacterium]
MKSKSLSEFGEKWSQREHLAFDDRWLMLIGIPIFSLAMPFILDLDQTVYGPFWQQQIPHSFVFVVGFWVFYRWVVILLRMWFPQYQNTYKRLLLEVIILLFSAPLLKGTISGILDLLIGCLPSEMTPIPSSTQNLLRIYLPTILIFAIYEAIFFFVQYKRELQARERAETAHVKAELDNLRNQINPHFLFNSLNTLMNLIQTDSEAAIDYLTRLSKFYRYTVSTKEEKLIPLSKEHEFAHLYSELLKTRFGEGLQFECHLKPDQQYRILPLSLQLLIENAVKHNIVSRNQPLHIKIDVDQPSQTLIVKNNLQRKLESVSSTGIGLKNIKQRFSYFTDRPIEIFETRSAFSVHLPLLPVTNLSA